MDAMTGREFEELVASLVGTSQINSLVLVWMSVPHPAQQARARASLLNHLQAKMRQMQAARAGGFLVDARTGAVVVFLSDNRLPGPDPQLDQLIAAARLRPPSALPRSLPSPKARRRMR
ncbi:hypothetical protein [Streptomyces sp. WAC08401]|uniref:hypothetical protein n=1 Tax=Streptomyces sp. WAC08401 TaxID=2487413 RepID=UPI000FAE2231|nr:hypothetical protein [Streptomyces sp. WAC08401]RSS14061.1 hypothetical protein EF915_18715 [Streptomyces sp. WAC08401]